MLDRNNVPLLVAVAEFENNFFYLRKTNLKIIINEKQQLHQTAVNSRL